MVLSAVNQGHDSAFVGYRCRADSAQISPSRPTSGLGLSHFQVKLFNTFSTHDPFCGQTGAEISFFSQKRGRQLLEGCAEKLDTKMVRECQTLTEREFCIDNLLVRIHFIIVMSRWTGLAPWESKFPFPGPSLTSNVDILVITFLALVG